MIGALSNDDNDSDNDNDNDNGSDNDNDNDNGSDNDNDSDNITKKKNLRPFKLYRVYLEPAQFVKFRRLFLELNS